MLPWPVPSFWSSSAVTPAISGAAAEVPQKYSNEGCSHCPPRQSRRNSRHGRKPKTKYLAYNVRTWPRARRSPVCQFGVAITVLTPPPEEATCVWPLEFSGSFHPPSGM